MLDQIPLLALINFAAVLNVVALAAILLIRPMLRTKRAGTRLAFFLLSIGFLLSIFTAEYYGWIEPRADVRAAYYALALVAGPLALDYVRVALGLGICRPVAYLPPIIFVVLVLVGGSEVLVFLGIEHVIAVEILYTLRAVWLYAARADERQILKGDHLFYFLTCLAFVHLMQVMRMVWPNADPAFDAIPYTGAILLFTFVLYAVARSNDLVRFAESYPVTLRGHEPELDQLEIWMAAERPFLDPDLALSDLAGRLGLNQRQLSKLLNDGAGVGFYGFINRFRIGEAMRLLDDPAEAETSMEAICLLSGFRSQSSFTEAFQKVTSQTPDAYRLPMNS